MVVLSARSGSFSVKKRRFLKVIRIFAGIRKPYSTDYQYLLCNAENTRFSSPKDNVPANIACICSQNSLFVDFIHTASTE